MGASTKGPNSHCPTRRWRCLLPREVTEALVLWGVDYSETSRILTFLTPGRGRVSGMVKGVRRKNSPLAAVLDTLNHVELVYLWKDGRQVQTVTDASLITGFAGIRADLERSAYASFPVEVAARAAHENDPSEGLFAVLMRGLRSLERWPGSVPVHALWQVWQVLKAAGFAPSLEVCCHCGLGLPGDQAGYGFRYDGGVACARCPADRRITGAQLVALRLLAAEDAGPGTIDYNHELFYLTRHYAGRQLESDFRSVRVLNELFPQ